MMNLKVCEDFPISHFEAIARSKDSPRRETLLALRPSINGAFQKYRIARGALQLLQPLLVSKSDHADLLHCYDSDTKALDYLKARIKASQSSVARAICQYCMVDAPETYDHYLPKSKFPEYAVCLHNLIPCCATCNLRRSAAWLSSAGERNHLHLYWDAIDQGEEVLFADLSFAEVPSANFHLDLSKVGSKPFFRLLERHFDQLNLRERFRVASAAELSEHHSQIRVLRGHLSPEEIAAVFRDALVAMLRRDGPHHWKVALLRAVRDSPRFIQFALDTPISVWNKQDDA
ncbi:hypothetical protein EJ065_2203 [Corallococcus coralloides]|uniref:HNH domain-containing protein n=1 Tax=Corallococcus coralloides TaxID=184914 RepID=A0A410RPL8_CORCK|nr:hypothetical protein [Corallococcus coralloides]QAT83786.1 hypothetical protein EJ065_2203 [Corallococcus coralloides]